MTKPVSPRPYLVESFEGDPEALAYTIVVKGRITFQDRTPLDAEAIKWNLDYYKGKWCFDRILL